MLAQISRRYLRSWFLIDLVSCFPITYIELAVAAAANSENDGAGQNLKVLKVVRLLRLAKLLRLARVKRLIERLEEEYEGVAQVVGMSKIIAIILFIAHFIACLWYFVGSMGGSMTFGLDPNNPAQTEVVQGWVYQNGWRDDEAGGLESDFCSSEAGYKSCRVDYQTRYWDALYFSVTTLTTVGFGDRTPTTNSEKVYSIVAELAGCVIFGIIAGSLGRLATSTSISEVEKHHQKKQLEEFMKIKRVPSKVKHEVIEQMDHWFAKKSMFDENQLLAFLPPKHRKQLLLVIYKPYLTTCPLLAGMDDIVLTKLCVVMRPYLALKQDEIMTEDDVGEEMYMVVRGEIKLTSQTAPRYNKRSWHDGAFFGELTVLGAGAGPQRNRHIYSAEAVVESELTFITQQAIDRIETHNPTFKNKMRRMALQRAKVRLPVVCTDALCCGGSQ
jgi:CRP-like cAMP-binding protein